MQHWLWDWVAGRGCKGGEESVSEGSQSSEKIAIGSQRKGTLYYVLAISCDNLGARNDI